MVLLIALDDVGTVIGVVGTEGWAGATGLDCSGETGTEG